MVHDRVKFPFSRQPVITEPGRQRRNDAYIQHTHGLRHRQTLGRLRQQHGCANQIRGKTLQRLVDVGKPRRVRDGRGQTLRRLQGRHTVMKHV